MVSGYITMICITIWPMKTQQDAKLHVSSKKTKESSSPPSARRSTTPSWKSFRTKIHQCHRWSMKTWHQSLQNLENWDWIRLRDPTPWMYPRWSAMACSYQQDSLLDLLSKTTTPHPPRHITQGSITHPSEWRCHFQLNMRFRCQPYWVGVDPIHIMFRWKTRQVFARLFNMDDVTLKSHFLRGVWLSL